LGPTLYTKIKMGQVMEFEAEECEEKKEKKRENPLLPSCVPYLKLDLL